MQVNVQQMYSKCVDIIYNAKEDKCYCLEVNTAPGIEGTTCVSYATAILQGMK